MYREDDRRIGVVVGRQVAHYRKVRGWVQSDLAARVGFRSHAAISRIERGELIPSLPLLVRLARVLGVSVRTLLRQGPTGAPEVTEAALEEARVLGEMVQDQTAATRQRAQALRAESARLRRLRLAAREGGTS